MAAERRCRISVLLLIGLLWLGYTGGGSWGEVDSVPERAIFTVPYFPVPERLDLCGEAAPLDQADVRERFDREFTSIVYSHGKVFLWLKRIERYFPWVEKQLASQKLPDDLKYVAVAESDLMVSALSGAGAAGPWQFMPLTAVTFGMVQSAGVDERYDFETSGLGAFKYLKNLHDSLDSWTLAVAAYNCGEKRVQDEIKRQKRKSYYELKLPGETERYVFRILAIKEVLSHPESYGFHLPAGAGYRPLPVDKVTLSLPGPLPVLAAADAAGLSYREMRRINPSLVSDTIPKGSVTLRVPEGRGKEFEQKISAMKIEPKPAFVYHKVAKGETLDSIARKYNVPGGNIRTWNRLDNRKLRQGQVLKIYR